MRDTVNQSRHLEIFEKLVLKYLICSKANKVVTEKY